MKQPTPKFFKGEIVFAVIAGKSSSFIIKELRWSNFDTVWEYISEDGLVCEEPDLYATFREAELVRARFELAGIHERLSQLRQEELDCQNLIDRLSVQIKSLVHVVEDE